MSCATSIPHLALSISSSWKCWLPSALPYPITPHCPCSKASACNPWLCPPPPHQYSSQATPNPPSPSSDSLTQTQRSLNYPLKKEFLFPSCVCICTCLNMHTYGCVCPWKSEKGLIAFLFDSQFSLDVEKYFQMILNLQKIQQIIRKC